MILISAIEQHCMLPLTAYGNRTSQSKSWWWNHAHNGSSCLARYWYFSLSDFSAKVKILILIMNASLEVMLTFQISGLWLLHDPKTTINPSRSALRTCHHRLRSVKHWTRATDTNQFTFMHWLEVNEMATFLVFNSSRSSESDIAIVNRLFLIKKITLKKMDHQNIYTQRRKIKRLRGNGLHVTPRHLNGN